MPNDCSVVGCKKRARAPGDNKKKPFLWYLLFCETKVKELQNRSKKRRDEWIARINRKDWTPTENSRLCAKHFINGMIVLQRKTHEQGQFWYS